MFLPLVPTVANIQEVFVDYSISLCVHPTKFHHLVARYTQQVWVYSQEKGMHMYIKETYFKWPIAKLIQTQIQASPNVYELKFVYNYIQACAYIYVYLNTVEFCKTIKLNESQVTLG